MAGSSDCNRVFSISAFVMARMLPQRATRSRLGRSSLAEGNTFLRSLTRSWQASARGQAFGVEDIRVTDGMVVDPRHLLVPHASIEPRRLETVRRQQHQGALFLLCVALDRVE